MAEQDQEQVKLNAEQSKALGSFANKAMTSGYDINPEDQSGGGALRREFLEDEIATLTYQQGDLEFYNDLPKQQSESTVVQYALQEKRGRVGHSRFVREVDVASQNDPKLRKRAVRMKYVSDTRVTSLVSQLVNNLKDPMRVQTDDAIAVVAKTIEWATFYGDGSLSNDPSDPDGGVEFTGLTKLIAKENIIDAKGHSLSEEMLNDAAVRIGKGFGTATDAYMPIGVHADFINKYVNRQTQLMRDNSTGDMELGFGVDAFRSARGKIKLHGSTVMENDNVLDEDIIAPQYAPRAPKVTAQVVQDGKGKFRPENDQTDSDLRTQSYKVTVDADAGPSNPSEAVTAVVSNETDGVELSIELNGLAEEPQFVSIFRQGYETGEYYLLDRIGVKELNEDGLIVFTDHNDRIPETADVFIGEMNSRVITLFELLPMMRLQLARMNATVTFSVLWYGALALRAPKKFAWIKNVHYIATKNPHGAGIREGQ